MNELANNIETLPSNPANLLQIAVQNGASVDQLSALMDLQKRWDDENARKAFYVARVQFQALCTTIKKDKKVEYGNTKYQYASLPAIADQVREPMETCGLTYRFEIDDSGELIRVTCILSHVAGHSEKNIMSAAPDDSGAKNNIQQRGSSVSYLQRYTLIGALGIASAVEDDDGQSSGEMNIDRLIRHNTAVREHFSSVAAIKDGIATNDYEQAAEAWGELEKEVALDLWLAKNKGGIFTTEERSAMQSSEWVAARKNNSEETT